MSQSDMTTDLSHHDLCQRIEYLEADRQTIEQQLARELETIARVRRYCQARNNPSVNTATHTACNDVLKILGEE